MPRATPSRPWRGDRGAGRRRRPPVADRDAGRAAGDANWRPPGPPSRRTTSARRWHPPTTPTAPGRRLAGGPAPGAPDHRGPRDGGGARVGDRPAGASAARACRRGPPSGRPAGGDLTTPGRLVAPAVAPPRAHPPSRSRRASRPPRRLSPRTASTSHDGPVRGGAVEGRGARDRGRDGREPHAVSRPGRGHPVLLRQRQPRGAAGGGPPPGDAGRLRVTTAARSGYRLVTIRFRAQLFYGDTPWST